MPAPAPYLRSVATAIPPTQLSRVTLRDREHDRYEAQLAALTPALRARLETQLGIENVTEHRGPPSELARTATARALERAGLAAHSLGAILDFSTMPGDYPAIAALTNQVQHDLGAERAVPFAVSGSGCAGGLLALRVAAAWLEAHGGSALLFGADCLPSDGRCSLPISLMGDAASAAVLSAEPPPAGGGLRLRAVTTTTVGQHHALVRAVGSPPRIEVDAAAFEERILPLHFVMCQRVLQRALAAAHRPASAITHLVYPNTTALDRSSVLRALDLPGAELCGPGPTHLGHAFANDLFINFPDLAQLEPATTIAMLGVGSGFTWGAAIFDVEAPAA